MCGRFSFSDTNDLRHRFTLIDGIDLPARYNIAPTQLIPAIINNQGNQLTMMKWGLIPFWAKDPTMGSKLINARAETIDEKPSFRTSFQRRRCLIPADGFYEWKKQGQAKQPYRITLSQQEVFAFAGLWDTWKTPQGEVVNSCTIITTTPNELIEAIHDRMPVILPVEMERVWLDPVNSDSHLLKDLLKPYPAELMVAYPVTALVNSPNNDMPECILRLGS